MIEIWRSASQFRVWLAMALATGVAGGTIGCGGGGGDTGGGATSAPSKAATAPAESATATDAGGSEAPAAETSGTTSATADAAPAAGVGSLTGVVRYQGDFAALPPLIEAGDAAAKDAAVCSKDAVPDESLLVNTAAGNGMANVFVYLAKAPKGFEVPPAAEEPLVMDQRNCLFIPHAMVIRVGQTVLVKSGDAVPHNVHSFPQLQTPFNQICQPNESTGLKLNYERGEAEPVQIKCDIHPWMRAWHLPLDHPFGAVTDSEGRFTIEGLPAGEHKFRVWHEKAGFIEKSLTVTIKPDEPAEVTIDVSAEKLAANIRLQSQALISSR